MACRVGISTNPQERIDYWKREEGHTYGKVLHSGYTYDGAQRKEVEEATARGCHHAPGGYPGGDRHRRVWSVYYVSGGTIS